MILGNAERRFTLVRACGDFAVRIIKAEIHPKVVTGLKRKSYPRRHGVVITKIGTGTGPWIPKERQLIGIAVEVLQIGVLLAVAKGYASGDGIT